MNILAFAVLNNSESNDGAGVLLGIFFIFIGALLCYAGSKLKGRNGDTTASRDKPDDDSGGKPRLWWKTDPKYDGALRSSAASHGLEIIVQKMVSHAVSSTSKV